MTRSVSIKKGIFPFYRMERGEIIIQILKSVLIYDIHVKLIYNDKGENNRCHSGLTRVFPHDIIYTIINASRPTRRRNYD